MTKLNLFPNEDYNLDKRKKGEIDSELEKGKILSGEQKSIISLVMN